MTHEKTSEAARRRIRKHNPYDGQNPIVIPNPGAIRPHEGPFYSPYYPVDATHEELEQSLTLPREAPAQTQE